MSDQRRFGVSEFATNADRFDAYEELCDTLEANLSAMTQRAEAAEARIRDAQEQEQEPVAFGSQCTTTKKWGYIWHTLEDVLGWVNLQHQSRDDCTYSAPIPLYAAPQPSPETGVDQAQRLR